MVPRTFFHKIFTCAGKHWGQFIYVFEFNCSSMYLYVNVLNQKPTNIFETNTGSCENMTVFYRGKKDKY